MSQRARYAERCNPSSAGLDDVLWAPPEADDGFCLLKRMDVLAYLVSVRDSLATGVRGRFQAYHLADDDSILDRLARL
eukprot:COSAG01_NODE_33412_length_564_cov_2.782796_1_plen_78_part_00